MRRITSQFLVACSLLGIAPAATRPHYGGTLHLKLQSAPNVVDLPVNAVTGDYWDAARVLALIADNLVTIDPLGRAQPDLAVAWQNDSSARHWQFTLRRGVKLHDGSPLTAAVVAQLLGPL